MQPEDNNLPSVETVLTAPQNQPTQNATDLAPAVGVQNAAPPVASQGDPSSLAPQGAMPASQQDRTPDIMGAALSAAKDGLARRSSGAAQPNDGAIATLVKSLQGSAQPAAQPVAPLQPPAQPTVTAQPPAQFQVTEAPSPFGRGNAFGYDYSGIRVELPSTVNAKDANAIKQYADFTNQIIDWMNNEED